MNQYRRHSDLIIWLSFLVAVILQIMPWPTQLCIFRPSWLSLLLIYWVMVMPHRINVSTGFILGLIMDLILGSTLGIHTLALSVLAYIAVFTFQLFRNVALWQQVIIVIILSSTTQVIIFGAEFLVTNISFRPEIFWSSLTDGVLWPWLFLLMRKVRYQFIVQ